MPRARPGFERAHRGRAHGDHAPAARPAARKRLERGGGDVVPLAVHAVLGQVLGLDGLEGARAHVQRDVCALHATRGQRGEHARVEMQRRRGRGHGAGLAREHGLVALGVLRFLGGLRSIGRLLRALYVRRQRHVAVAFQERVGRRIGCVCRPLQREAKQRPVGVGPAPEQRGREATALRPARDQQRAAHAWLFAHFHVRDDLVACENALDQQLQLAAAGFLAKQARLEHARVVEHEQVARLQQRRQVTKDAIHGLRAAPVEQARGAALGRRVLRDQLGRQREVEVLQREVARRAGVGRGGKRHGKRGWTGPQ